MVSRFALKIQPQIAAHCTDTVLAMTNRFAVARFHLPEPLYSLHLRLKPLSLQHSAVPTGSGTAARANIRAPLKEST